MTAAPANAQPAEPAPPLATTPEGVSIRLTPISGPLGLADLTLTAPSGRVRSAVVVLRARGQTDAPIEVVMRPVPGVAPANAPANETLRARVMAGADRDGAAARKGGGEPEETITFSMRLETSAGVQAVGPFTRSAAPAANVRTPDWAKGAVWYQVFPERFRNGNPANDPHGPRVTLRPWTSDWSSVTVEELEAARTRAAAGQIPGRLDPQRQGGQLDNVLRDRRYGGDLQGVVEKLNELDDLGVTAIYLTPIFQARSAHKYDATDYRHVDATLGGPSGAGAPGAPAGSETENPATWEWTEADRYFVGTVLSEARRRGLRVVLDGVWGHVGINHWAFRDVLTRGKASPYRDWFDAVSAPDDLGAVRAAHPALDFRPNSLLTWKSWNGHNGSMPTWRRTADGRLPPEVEAHIFAVTRRWMDPDLDGNPSDGIDGWRLDAAQTLGLPFWEAWRAHAKAINPDAILIGELWGPAGEYFNGRAFDGQMNYPFARAVLEWLCHPAMTSQRLAAALEQVFCNAPQTDLVQMNLLDSHDTARLVTMIHNAAADPAASIDEIMMHRGADSARPQPEAYDLGALGLALQATYLGSPMVYYGDEYGMHGGNDPDCRKPLPWPDLSPNDNAQDRPVDGHRERYRTWLRLRQHPTIGPILRLGDVRHVDTGNPDVFAFVRSLNGRAVLVVLNRGAAEFDASALVATWGVIDPADAPGVVVPRAGARAVVPGRQAALWVTR